MKKPLVSIIVPSMNQGEFLEECLSSILDQDYPNIEVILIDGGSTDNTLDVIHLYSDRLSYWVSEPDRGQSHAINKGFKVACGDIVAWLNSDDVYFPRAVSKAVQQFQANPNLALFYGHCVYINEHGDFLRYFSEVEPWNKNRLLNFSDYIMQPTTFFSRAKLFHVGLLDETLHYGMDWDLWCKLALSGEVHYEQSIIAANREYGTTKTNSGSWRRLRELLKIQKRHMTGRWPHAFWGFCSTECRLKERLTNTFLARLFWRFLGNATLLLSPVGIIKNRQLSAHRQLYGLLPHSTKVTRGRAAIELPFIRNATALGLCLCTDRGNTITVETPDLMENLKATGNEMEVRLPLGEATLDKGYGCVAVRFSDSQGRPVVGEILKASWLLD